MPEKELLRSSTTLTARLKLNWHSSDCCVSIHRYKAYFVRQLKKVNARLEVRLVVHLGSLLS